MKKIPLATPTMHTEEQQYIQKAFETNWISPLGPNVDEFEDKVAAYVGASSSAGFACQVILKIQKRIWNAL